MASTATIEQTEAALRDLIAEESFEDAQRLLDDFAEAIENEIVGAAGDPERLTALRSRVAGFFAWAEARTRAHRACAESETARLRSLVGYDSGRFFAVTSASA